MARRGAWAGIAGLLVALVLAAGAAAAQSPVAPASGERVEGKDVVLRWTLDPGWHTTCVEWASRPETSYAGGPFLAQDGGTCLLDSQDVAYLLDGLGVGR